MLLNLRLGVYFLAGLGRQAHLAAFTRARAARSRDSQKKKER
jgi:hypothetical protein